MNNDYKNVLLKLLESIDYANDKEAFVNQFMGFVQVQSVNSLIDSLPADQQASIKNELKANKDNQEKIAELLKSKFSDEQIQKSIDEASKNLMMEWLQAVNPTLNDTQRQRLVALSQELNPTSSPATAV